MKEKNKQLLYLPVEVKVRELDAKLLLAYYAAKQGYQVIIGDHITVELAATEYPEGIFFSKGYPHGIRKRVITAAIDNGHTVIELDEEGLIFEEKKYLRDRMKIDMLQNVRQEYCWGQFQRDIIMGAYPELIDKCHVVGNPRFDLLKPKFKSIYAEDVKLLNVKYGDFVLFNTRFAKYNTAKGMKDNIHFKEIKKLYYSFLEMIKATCEKFPETNFIVRPHPGENFSSYREALADYSNVQVVHEGNIVKWLLAASTVIHNGCTSGIEAFLLGKPVITYVPKSSEKSKFSLPNQLGCIATTIECVQDVLSDSLSKPNRVESNFDAKRINDNENILLSYCDWSTNHFSYEAILSLCNQIKTPLIKRQKPTSTNIIPKQTKKHKRHFSLTEFEIRNFFNKLDGIEGNSSGLLINKIGTNLYQIQL